MNTINDKYQQMLSNVPQDIITEIDLSFAIASEIENLMRERGLTKKQFADALGRKPSEVTKWLSGQHNFTIRTLAMLSNFFGTPIIQSASSAYDTPNPDSAEAIYESRSGKYAGTLDMETFDSFMESID